MRLEQKRDDGNKFDTKIETARRDEISERPVFGFGT